MREITTVYIRRSAKEVLGISRGGGGRITGAWLQNEEMKEKVKEKQDAYATLIDSRADREKNIIKYKDAKKTDSKESYLYSKEQRI